MKKERKYSLFLEFLFLMTEKELRSRYKYTIFGFIWLIINPLLQMLTIGFIFTFFSKQPIDNYYFYLFIGLLVWNFFSLSLSKATPSIVWERNLIKKSFFPRAIIPISIVLSNLVHLVIAVILFLIPVVFVHQITLLGIFNILIAFILLTIFTSGIALFTSALNVKYRDVNFIVQALLIVWFYATPIIYELSMIPDRYSWIWRTNPLTSILQLMQNGFLGTPFPQISILIFNLIIIFTVFVVGIKTFDNESKDFDDWL